MIPPGLVKPSPEAAAVRDEAIPGDRAVGAAPAMGARPPRRLSETGLYLPDGSVDPRNRAFAPQYPLWTDGATKRRWVRLPEGSRIDAGDLDAWRFPAGAVFWKEFSWHGRRVETRMIRIGNGGSLTYATYVWNEDGSEAFVAPDDGILRGYEVAPGKWHAIPAVSDCRACHESGSSPVLGFGALQLSDDRDPMAPHAEPLPPGAVTLRSLVEEGWLSPERSALVGEPPRIRARDALERAALGYLSSNCGTCHQSRGPLARLGFSLRHDLSAPGNSPEPALSSVVGRAGRFVVPGDTTGSRLVEPGRPDRSAVLHRMMSSRAATRMPPLGTVIPDSLGIEIVRRWIRSLGSSRAGGGIGPS